MLIGIFESISCSNDRSEVMIKYVIDSLKQKIETMTEADINELVRYKKYHMVNDLANNILIGKWPKEENDQSIFAFIFEHYTFLMVFFIGN